VNTLVRGAFAGMVEWFDRWPRSARSWIKIGLDATLVAAAFIAASLLRFGGSVPPHELHTLVLLLPFVMALKVLAFCFFGMYLDLWRYAGLSVLVRVFRVVVISSLLVATFAYLLDFGYLPRGIFVIDAALTLIFVGAVRFGVRWTRDVPSDKGSRRRFVQSAAENLEPLERALIVGAGHAGEMMIREMRRRERWLRMQPVGFVDDDPTKKGMLVHGLFVLGGREEIPQICREQSVERIVLCLPSVPGRTIREIVRHCRDTGAKVDIVPRLEEILSGEAKLSDLRELRVDDLLGRQKIEFNMEQVCSYIQGRRVLVTGAGGSIGSELCRQVSRYAPAEIVLLGRGENSIYAIANELAEKTPHVKRHEVIGDVINRRKLEGVFRELRPEIVFHAGADKHVPLMEMNPDEAVLNNIVGTQNVLDVADETETQLLVAISTDKAVRPSSVMGCCKRVAEMIIQSRDRQQVVAAAVRFGNVLGSRGSVIPFFQGQIRKGGPVTVTHPDVERYFMTIPEAVALVLQAGALGRGGEVFVLDMGEPVRILDLAREMIRLAGLEPEEDIPILFSGLRPGEKLKEELVGPGQSVVETEHPKIMALRSERVDSDWLDGEVQKLQQAAVEMEIDEIIRLLGHVVKEYQPVRAAATPDGPKDPFIGIPPSSRTH
jgi:FlaA1/EpsC-like NDP-sugar epimerase